MTEGAARGRDQDVRSLICQWVQEALQDGSDTRAAGLVAVKRLRDARLVDQFLDELGPEVMGAIWLKYSVQMQRRRMWHGEARERVPLRIRTRDVPRTSLLEVPFYTGHGYVPLGDMTRADCAWQERREEDRITISKQRRAFWAELRDSLHGDEQTIRQRFNAAQIEALLAKNGLGGLPDGSNEDAT